MAGIEVVWENLPAGGKTGKELIKDGYNIVDFLMNPYTPCFITHKKYDGPMIATNFGNHNLCGYNNENIGLAFTSYFHDPYSNNRDSYEIHYLANYKIILHMPFNNNIMQTNLGKQQMRAGFIKLIYRGDVTSILSNFTKIGYRIQDFTGNFKEFSDIINTIENQQQIKYESIKDILFPFYNRKTERPSYLFPSKEYSCLC